MKRIFHLIFLVTLLLIVIGCSSNKVQNLHTIEYLDLPRSGEDTFKASYIADTVIYIPFEATPESYLDNIEQFWIKDSLILVKCFKGGLFLFNLHGGFIRRIGKIGHGPEEYITILHFEVMKDTIYVSSTGRKGLLKYTFDGKFHGVVRIDCHPTFFSETASHYLACYIEELGKIVLFDKEFCPVDTITVDYGVTKGRYYSSYGDYFCMPYFQQSSGGLLFNNYLTDTIWNIDYRRKEPAYILDIKDPLLPYDKQVEFFKGDLQRWKEISINYSSYHLINCPPYNIIIQKKYNDIKLSAIYLENNTTGQIKRFNTFYIYDDIVGKTYLNILVPVYNPDYLVTMGSWMSVKYMEEIGRKYKDMPSPSWMKQMKSIDEDANPVLVLVRLKKQ